MVVYRPIWTRMVSYGPVWSSMVQYGNIEAANRRKRERYEFLTTDIKEAGYQCMNMPFEIGSRGHVTRQNKITLAQLCSVTGVRKAQQVIKNCSKIVLLGSYSIYNSRRSHDWSGQAYSKP